MTFLTTNAVNHESTRQTRIEMFRGDSRLPWDVDRPPRVASTYRLFGTFAPESYVSSMSIPSKFVRLHPYFKLHSAKSHLLSPEQTQKRAREDRAELVKFLQGSDILILDTQYTDEEYQAHVGWGHGSLSSAISLAIDAAVRKLILFHHDPTHDDEMIDKMVQAARKLAAKSESYLEVEGAREGAEMILD